jgi:hypothetical protein
MSLMDVVTSYLYELIDIDIYIAIHEEFKMRKVYNSNSQKVHSINEDTCNKP